jgi:hypothetical protein
MRWGIPTTLLLLQGACALEVPPLVPRDAALFLHSDASPPHDGPCPDGQVRCGLRCVSLANDPEHCGRCGRSCGTGACRAGVCIPSDPCAEGSTRCDGRCVDTRTSSLHCGTCGRDCAQVPGADGTCEAGRCRCAIGRADCDGDPGNGCETFLADDPAHCGACGARCDPAHGRVACMAGACSVRACDALWGDCDGNTRNGCETPLTTASHCGSCDVACVTPANASAVCVVGTSTRCSFACSLGFADCDSNPSNGCETDLATSLRHCGRCNAPCNGTCVAGVCR